MGSEIRKGRVSAINYETGMMRVTYRDKDDSVTQEFPMLTNNDEYRMPMVGQDVLVAHLSNGSSRGVILGTLWNKKYNPYETGEKLYRKELSREKDAAYMRYSDEDGKYIVKAPEVHINGIDRTILDGPKLEIAANISILLQSDEMAVDTQHVTVIPGEGEAVTAEILADVNVHQEKNEMKAAILKMVLEFMEDMRIRAGTTIELRSEEDMKISSGGSAKIEAEEDSIISAGDQLILKDGNYTTSLKEIMERLEALGG